MSNAEEHVFTIRELAKLVGVSVRTLQYYDQKNLLNSTYNDSHKRVYTRGDLLKILQILFLKSLGIKLQEIKDIFRKLENSAYLIKIFTIQREIMMNRISNLNTIINTLNLAISEGGQEIGMGRLIAVSEFMKQGKPLSDKLRELDERGVNPAGKYGQEFAKQWWSIVGDFVDGDISLLKPLTIAGQDIENWPDEARYQKESAERFLAEAIRIYIQKNIR